MNMADIRQLHAAERTPKDAVFATSEGGPKVDPDQKGMLLAVTTRSKRESLPMKQTFTATLVESASP